MSNQYYPCAPYITGSGRKYLWSPNSIMDIFTLAQRLGVAIEVEWYEKNEAFVITIRKGTFKDCITISAEKLDSMRDEIAYVKNVIRYSAMAVNRAYEKEQDMYAHTP